MTETLASPMATRPLTPPRFWDKIAPKYAASPIRDPSAYEIWLARVVEHLGPQDTVLEVGCGTGSTALRLAPSVGSIVASDYSPGMIEIAKERLAETGLTNVSCVVADPFDEVLDPDRVNDGKGYDAVMAFNFLHLADDPAATIARLRAMVKPGGLFISKTVCLGGSKWLFGPMIAVMRAIGKAPRVHMLSLDGLDGMIVRAGFEILETQTFGKRAKGHFVVARKV